jgi:hypothetical protein
MDAARLIDRLEGFGAVLPPLTALVRTDDARFKPPGVDGKPPAWSILEIVNHLVDEETDDFRMRVRLTLEDPAQAWPPSDPERWARERLYKGQGYNDRDLAESVERFVGERAASVRWLRSLKNPDWERAHVHPKVGPLSAGMLLASWAAHDALHVRQIAKRLFELAARDGAPNSVRYAGEWGA